MGWTTCFYASNWKYDRNGRRTVDRRKECDALYTWERKEPVTGADGRVYPKMKDTVLKSAMVGRVYYAAVRREQEGKEPHVWGAVCLTCGRSPDGTVWGYKNMSEDSMPYFFDCPASILALLSPTDSEGANEWREECRKKIAAAAARRKNGPAPLFIPKGIGVQERKGSWIITSENYRRNSTYSAIRFTKVRWHEFDRAMRAFLANYGTKEERAEFAASGRECPAEWKVAAA